MEMLQAKQEQEKKRLREQMEAEAAVQRQQMENMAKARMMEHRRNFMQENQVLSQRLAQMQKSNEGMEKRVESLRQQLLLNQSRQQQIQKPGFFDRTLQMIPVLGGVTQAPYQSAALCNAFKVIPYHEHWSNS